MNTRQKMMVALFLFSLLALRPLPGDMALAAQPPGVWAKVPSQSIPSGQYTVQNELRGISMTSADDGWTVGWASNPNGPAYGEVTLIEHWDGSEFTIVPSPNLDSVNELYGVSADSPGDSWAVGYSFDPSSVETHTLVEHWDGGQWTITPSPDPAPGYNWLLAVKAFVPDNIWAAGFSEDIVHDGPQKTLLIQYNGTSWTQVNCPSPLPGSKLNAITGTSSSDLWVAGYVGNADSYSPLAMHWNGVAWSTYILPTGPGNPARNAINGLSESGPNDVWAVGYRDAGSTPLFDHWDGHTWTYFYPPQYPSSPYVPIYSVSTLATDCAWAVGELAGLPLIAFWDGAQWNNVPPASFGANYNVMFAVQALNTTNAFAAGNYNTLLQSPQQTLVEEYSAGVNSVFDQGGAGPLGRSPVGSFSAAPTPFHSRTDIAFTLTDDAPVDLRVYDVRGRLVSTILKSVRLARGRQNYEWAGEDDGGHHVPPGIYFVRLDASRTVLSRKVMRMK